MNYKITCHLMPWELDYALLSFTQLKKSKYYLDKDDKVYVDVTLNLSSYLIDWDESKISKEFFINKFESLQPLLKDYICRFKIYDGDQLYGGLNTAFESTEEHIDHYMFLNPDMYFSENLLAYLIESSKVIKNEYFIVTPQTSKLWDLTWDSLTHPQYQNIPYDNWRDIDVYDVRHFSKNNENPINLTPLDRHKWAGWMDLYNKKMWETFYSVEGWNGYGAHDWYTMQLTQYAKDRGVDIQQYILENQIVCEYESGPLKEGNLSKYYKDMLVLNNIPNQRQQFESKMNEYIRIGIQQLKEKNIL
jgi:hypothetical protein